MMRLIWRKARNSCYAIVIVALAFTQFSFLPIARAQVNTISMSLAAAEPTTYSHETGGGFWGNGRENIEIRRSLEGENFACNDMVTYLTKVSVPNNPALVANGVMTLDLNYSISMDTTGESGVALGEPVSAIFNSGDSANKEMNSSSTVSIINTSQTGEMFTKGAELLKTVRLTDVEAGEDLVVRVDVKLHCKAGSQPTGNLQFRLKSGLLTYKNGSTPVTPAEALNVGEQTISLKNVQALAIPSIVIEKTVTTATGACPGGESITIEPTQQVKFCYAVTNNSNTGGKIGAPLYNVSQISDDNGGYPPFTLSLSSGLTDIDSDGTADDLAIGATAYGSYVTAFDGTADSVVTNIATISGYSLPTGGTQYSDSDSAMVNIDAPAPAMTLVKLTNGTDGSTFLVGTALTWTYLVTNTGDRLLTGISVVDDQGVSVTCPAKTLEVSASMTCSATGVAIAGNYVNVGTATGTWDSTQVTATDNSSYFGANPKLDVQKTPDTQSVIEGSKASFTITVTNTGNVVLTSVAVTDAMAPGCDKSIGDLAVAGQATYTCQSPTITANMTNTAVVTGMYGATQVTDDDSANVTVDYLPNISVTKTANPTSVFESGEDVTFTFTVKNNSAEPVLITKLEDDKFGDLNGLGTCATSQLLSGNESYSCTVTKKIGDWTLTPFNNTVTATGQDNEGNTTTASASATVTIKDLLPKISVTKTANPTIVRSTGENVVYTIKIANTGPESVTVTSLIDSVVTLSPECAALVGVTIPISGEIQCTTTVLMVIGAGSSFTNTATAIAKDNENNSATASASAVIKSYWFGRTPGYWKNHASAWISGYLPTQYVQGVFTIPTSLLSVGILDLDGNKSKDTLITALNYQGGTKLAGGAQILLRAAVAALLNEAYYGADYPAASSTTELINNVNTVLATLDRNQYIALAVVLDKWNNGVEGPLP